jgi:hypothetical protein
MIGAWRGWALTAGVLICIGGIAVWAASGGPVLLIIGAVVLVTAALEPIYGRAVGRPAGGNLRPTDEKFIDPESGKLVTVWYDAVTGERRYVAEGEREERS